MSVDNIKGIVARYAARADPSKWDEALIQNFVSELARDSASTFFLGIQHSVETLGLRKLSKDERRKWLVIVDDRTEQAAAFFSSKVEMALSDDGVQNAAEIARYAKGCFLDDLQRLAKEVGQSSGNA